MPKRSLLRLIEIAELLGVSKQRAHQIASARDFPDPVARDGRGRLWNRRDVTFHGLRHSSAILALSAGVDVRTVAGRLGHANPSITLSTYAHYVRSADEAAASKLEGLLGG